MLEKFIRVEGKLKSVLLVLILSFFTCTLFAGQFPVTVTTHPTQNIVQQIVEVAVNSENCTIKNQGFLYCSLVPNFLDLPQGGKIVGVHADNNEEVYSYLARELILTLPLVFIRSDELEPSAFESLIESGEVRVQLIYQGTEIQ